MPHFPDTTPITTRLAAPKDFERIAVGHVATHAEHAVRETGFAAEAPFIAPYLQARPLWKKVLPRILPQSKFLWIAERHRAQAGHLAACRTRLGRHRALQIADITVYDGFRAQRVGRCLVQMAETTARREKLEAVVALIWPGNAPSQAFFTALGYTLAPYTLPDRELSLIAAVKQLS